MDPYEQLEALLELARELEMAVRPMPAAFDGDEHPGGALTRIGAEQVLFLDRQAGVADQLAVVAKALAGREEIENRYLPPELRQCIRQYAGRSEPNQ